MIVVRKKTLGVNVLPMRAHWTDAEAKDILGLKYESNVSQALNPARQKFARLGLANFEKTLAMLLDDIAELRAQQRFESELPHRQAMLTGKADRHPR